MTGWSGGQSDVPSRPSSEGGDPLQSVGGAAGYMPITLLADNPPLVDVVDGVVGIEDGQMRVLAVKH
jgi:hypothetical protein